MSNQYRTTTTIQNSRDMNKNDDNDDHHHSSCLQWKAFIENHHIRIIIIILLMMVDIINVEYIYRAREREYSIRNGNEYSTHTHVKRRIFLPFGHDFSVDSEKMKNPKNQPKQWEKRAKNVSGKFLIILSEKKDPSIMIMMIIFVYLMLFRFGHTSCGHQNFDYITRYPHTHTQTSSFVYFADQNNFFSKANLDNFTDKKPMDIPGTYITQNTHANWWNPKKMIYFFSGTSKIWIELNEKKKKKILIEDDDEDVDGGELFNNNNNILDDSYFLTK